MTSKKIGVSIIALFSLVLLAAFVSAEVQIKKEAVSSMAIPELNLPAIFNIEVTNLGAADTFSIYSLSGMSLEPNASFDLNSGQTKAIVLKALPTFPLQSSPQYYSFEYKVKGEKAGIQSEELAISLVNLKDAFNFYIDDITPESSNAVVHLENKGGQIFEKVKLTLSSDFFTQSTEFSMNAFEAKRIEVALNEKTKELLAGPYIVNAQIAVGNVSESSSAVMNFNEKPAIATAESSTGIIINTYEVEKKNNGNTKADASITISKNLFSSLFTSFNIAPNRKELSGFTVNYIFTKNLSPNESLQVVAKTNWWILIGIIIVLIVIYYLIDEYIRNKLVLNKKISFVRTKGGEFALKVSITARARDFIEKIRIMDRLPPMVKVFERYGLIAPDRIDTVNRRLEWNISALSRGEVREVSYIIYSKIGVVGRFELPPAEAIYEYKGKIREAESNKAFYDNEPRKREE